MMVANGTPRVTILTAVRNGDAYLDTAIASIVAQSFSDFEYILIDDASSDATPAILASWAARDPRIRVMRNAHSLNAGGALNRGLAEAAGEYLAILDGDDIAYPTRVAEQVSFLDTHPSVSVVGSQAMIIDAAGNELGPMSPFPTAPAVASWRFMFHCPVLHSAAMMRNSLLEQVGGYSVAIWAATEYELFVRLSETGQVSNLPTTLVAYRESPQQLSSVHRQAQVGQVLSLVQELAVARLGLDKARPSVTGALFQGVRGEVLSDEEELSSVRDLLEELHRAFLAKTVLCDEERQWIAEECACVFLLLAWVHRHPFRLASRKLLARGLELDPHLWTRPRTRSRLRRLHASLRARN
jgi:glycosyltransferase involved in cell wall biosynthesis